MSENLTSVERSEKLLDKFLKKGYEAGFSSDVESEQTPKGLNEKIIRMISAMKDEPDWLLQWRLKSYKLWLKMPEPAWANLNFSPIDYQSYYYYSKPKSMIDRPETLDDVDPEILKAYQKLGIPLEEQKRLSGVAVDAIFDSVSVLTTYKEALKEKGIIFSSFSEAVQDYPDLVKKYLGSVVPPADNKHAALNSAVFTDGSFVYIPPNTRCPVELSTYFRINSINTGQFERTLIIADEGSYVSYMEGCSAPMRDENQLHAAVVEIIALKDAQVKYSTVQNWYPGSKDGKGGVYNFVTKRGICKGKNSKISWIQVETGSAITWKYPSCILAGDNSVGEFLSIAITNNKQQADTGTKMTHIGKNTRSTILSKGISAGKSSNTYRGLVLFMPSAEGAVNNTRCDSLLIGDECRACTVPYIDSNSAPYSQIEHEATTMRIRLDQLFYCQQRGFTEEEATSMIVSGFCREIISSLPMEFAVEAQSLIGLSLEGGVG